MVMESLQHMAIIMTCHRRLIYKGCNKPVKDVGRMDLNAWMGVRVSPPMQRAVLQFNGKAVEHALTTNGGGLAFRSPCR